MSELTAAFPILAAKPSPKADLRLSQAHKGCKGTIAAVAEGGRDAEMERRLLEMGFVEGAQIEVLHEGPFGGDPMVVRLDDMRVALRRAEADLVQIGPGGVAS